MLRCEACARKRGRVDREDYARAREKEYLCEKEKERKWGEG